MIIVNLLLQPEKDWDDYSPVTEYERALPWYHDRFAYKELDDEEEYEDVSNQNGSVSEDDDDAGGLLGPLAKELTVRFSFCHLTQMSDIESKALRSTLSAFQHLAAKNNKVDKVQATSQGALPTLSSIASRTCHTITKVVSLVWQEIKDRFAVPSCTSLFIE